VVAEECRAVREGVGLLDISGFSRFEVSGPNAESWLDRLMASKLPGPGRARLAPMLAGRAAQGRSDRVQLGRWHLVDHGQSYYLREWHMRWFHDHMADGVTVRDLGDQMAGFSLAGPEIARGDRAADRRPGRANCPSWAAASSTSG
jgi:dimethylglycine dehydrogenase